MARFSLFPLAFLLCGVLLLPAQAPAAAGLRAAASAPDLSDGVIMAGGSAVDIQWTAATYAGEDFTKWQLRRDTVPATAETVVFESAQTATLIHRDTVPVPGAKYRYTIWHDECWWVSSWPYTKECGWRKKTDMEVDTSALRGWVTSDLTVAPGTYTGWLIVNPATKLAMRPGTTISGSSYFYGGGLEIDGVTFGQTQIRFGKLEDGTSGSGGVRGCTFLGESSIRLLNASQGIEVSRNTSQGPGLSVSLYGTSRAQISGNTGAFNVSLDNTASAQVTDNSLTAIALWGANDLVAEHNTLSDGVFIWGAGSTAQVRRNTFISDDPTYVGEEGHGILARTGTRVTAEDNTLINTDPSEYGIMTIQAEGDAVLIARRNRVVGAIVVIDDVDATLTDNVITKTGLAASATRTKEITGNTIGSSIPNSPTRHATFYKTVPAAALITNNCFRNLSLWVNVEGPRSAYLNLRGNYWGNPSGPKTSANPGGTGVTLNGASYALWEPFDRTGAMCLDEPPPPPVQVGSLELTAQPDRLIPNGRSDTAITARVRDPQGNPARLVTVAMTFEPAIGSLRSSTCVTGDEGTCRVFYVAPTPAQAAGGVPQVVITGNAGGQTDTVAITLDYLRVVERYPSHDTRNADPRALFLAATFDRDYNPRTIGFDTFWVSSSVYYDRLLCVYGEGGPSIASCTLDDLSGDANARKGLILTVHLKGGPNGVQGMDGAFLAQDVTWQIYTTPEMAPRIVATQVADAADLIGSKPALVRVLGGLSEETELDWVEADVKLTYVGLGSFERKAHRFYPGQTGLNEAYLRGNSANFSSRAGEVPIVGPNMTGEHRLLAVAEPVAQLNPPNGVPRRYNAEAVVRVRPLARDYGRLLVASYPMVPTDHPLHEFPYPWQVGQQIAAARTSPAVTEGRASVERWTPLWGMEQTVGTRGTEVWAPLIPNPKNDGAWYLARLVRHADWQAVPLVPSGVYVLLAPWEWMQTVNGGPTYHGPAQHVCLTAVDAPAAFNPAATLAWCISHLHGVPDASGPTGHALRGYDLERDRLVDDTFPATGYRLPVMAFDRTAWAAGPHNLWMDTASYGLLMSRMAGAAADSADSSPPTVRSADFTPRAAPATASLTIGGEVIRNVTAETGAVDIVELPARGAFPAPDGSGEYQLRLLDAGGALLAEHTFTPVFSPLGQRRDYASFLFNVPAPAGVRSVELRRGAVPLGTLAASANPPTVAIQAPAAGSYSGALAASWSGSDADAGAELRYTALLSPDNGATWALVTLSTAAQALTVDTTQYPNCTACRLKVIAHDGFHSAEAISAPFAVANPPAVLLTWPPDGTTDAGCLTIARATFRDAMDPASLAAGSFTLTAASGQGVTGTVTYDPATRTVSLTPSAALAYRATYTARLASTVCDAAGRPLGSDVTWRFTVEGAPIRHVWLPVVLR